MDKAPNSDIDEIEKILQEAECDFTKRKSTKTQEKKVRRLIGFVGGVTDEPLIKRAKHKIGFNTDTFEQ